MDELFVTIRGARQSLWRVVEQNADVFDTLLSRNRDKKAAKRFFRKVLKHPEGPPLQLVAGKLRTYPAAHREVFPSVTHRTEQYQNKRVEVSHQHTREQERQMRRLKSAAQVRLLCCGSLEMSRIACVAASRIRSRGARNTTRATSTTGC